MGRATAETAFRRNAAACGAAFGAGLAAVMASPQPEGPHRARVALRRLRALLRAARPMLSEDARRAVEARAKAIFAVLSPLRDADVLALHAPGDAGATARADAARAQARDALCAMEAAAFPAELAAFCETPASWGRGRRARTLRAGPAADLAARALTRAFRRARAQGKDIAAMADETRHALRKDLKNVRYMVEFFAESFSGSGPRRSLAALRDLQEALGTLTDLTVARSAALPAARAALEAQEAAALELAQRLWARLRRMKRWWRRRA